MARSSSRRPRPLRLLPAVACGLLVLAARPAAPAAAAPSWSALVRQTADRTTIGQLLRKAGLRLPRRAYALMARVVPGAGQPAFAYYSLETSGWGYPRGRFWPASAVKLIAAVGALLTLRRHGLDGRARLRFHDGFGAFAGTAAQLYGPALLWSSNRAYDRLLRVAGLDDFHHHLRRHGLPQIVLQCPYAASDLRGSPAIHYRQGRRHGTIPARRSTARFPRCPAPGNCATLLALQESLRRVVFHRQLPKSMRFPLGAGDVRRLRHYLRRAKSKFTRAARRVLGRVVIYNKAGRYPGWDHLDNALIVARRGPKVLLTISVPYTRRYPSDGATARLLERIATVILRGLARRAPQPPPLQRAHGALEVGPTGPSSRAIAVVAPRAAQLRAWLGGRPTTVRLQGGAGRFLVDLPARRDRLLVLQARDARGRPVAWRAHQLPGR